MKTSPRCSFPWSVGLAVLAVAACIDVRVLKKPTGSGGASASSGRGGAAGSGGEGAPDARRAGYPLVPDLDGRFYKGTAGVVGGWWWAGDFYGPDNTPGTGTCPMAGFSPELCSVVTMPLPGTAFRPTPGHGMCTAGIAAKVLFGSDGQPAWSAIWGNTIGFTLHSDADAGIDTWGTYDAPAHGFAGLAFDIDRVDDSNMRVSFATRGTENNPAYWLGPPNQGSDDLSPIHAAGHYEILWPDVGGPRYLANPPPFDPATLEAIRFDSVSNTSRSIAYSFCISNVTLLAY